MINDASFVMVVRYCEIYCFSFILFYCDQVSIFWLVTVSINAFRFSVFSSQTLLHVSVVALRTSVILYITGVCMKHINIVKVYRWKIIYIYEIAMTCWNFKFSWKSYLLVHRKAMSICLFWFHICRSFSPFSILF